MWATTAALDMRRVRNGVRNDENWLVGQCGVHHSIQDSQRWAALSCPHFDKPAARNGGGCVWVENVITE